MSSSSTCEACNVYGGQGLCIAMESSVVFPHRVWKVISQEAAYLCCPLLNGSRSIICENIHILIRVKCRLTLVICGNFVLESILLYVY